MKLKRKILHQNSGAWHGILAHLRVVVVVVGSTCVGPSLAPSLAKLLSRFICPVVSMYAMYSSGGMPRLINCSPNYKLQASVFIPPNLSDPNAAPPGWSPGAVGTPAEGNGLRVVTTLESSAPFAIHSLPFVRTSRYERLPPDPRRNPRT